MIMGDDRDVKPIGTPMTEARIDFGFRIYWTKMATKWDMARIRDMRARVIAVTQQPDFEKNLIERRFKVEGLDELAHSGASLLALIEVLNALETYEANNG
ncbi:MAG: hypothetical protein HY862_21280 [Chloroflexi bacterium]|nr:hypothetical protein [Chloroflexota bacterium]